MKVIVVAEVLLRVVEILKVAVAVVLAVMVQAVRAALLVMVEVELPTYFAQAQMKHEQVVAEEETVVALVAGQEVQAAEELVLTAAEMQPQEQQTPVVAEAVAELVVIEMLPQVVKASLSSATKLHRVYRRTIWHIWQE